MLVYRIGVTRAERQGATEENCVRIHAIDAWEALGYRGCGREEHSGEPVVPSRNDLASELADNRAGQIAGR